MFTIIVSVLGIFDVLWMRRLLGIIYSDFSLVSSFYTFIIKIKIGFLWISTNVINKHCIEEEYDVK